MRLFPVILTRVSLFSAETRIGQDSRGNPAGLPELTEVGAPGVEPAYVEQHVEGENQPPRRIRACSCRDPCGRALASITSMGSAEDRDGPGHGSSGSKSWPGVSPSSSRPARHAGEFLSARRPDSLRDRFRPPIRPSAHPPGGPAIPPRQPPNPPPTTPTRSAIHGRKKTPTSTRPHQVIEKVPQASACGGGGPRLQSVEVVAQASACDWQPPPTSQLVGAV